MLVNGSALGKSFSKEAARTERSGVGGVVAEARGQPAFDRPQVHPLPAVLVEHLVAADRPEGEVRGLTPLRTSSRVASSQQPRDGQDNVAVSDLREQLLAQPLGPQELSFLLA